MTPFASPAVENAFGAFPPRMRRKLLGLRELVFQVAARTEGVGRIEETLKWGEPAYLTPQSKSGSTLRMGWKKSEPSRYAMYFHCQTTLIETFRTLFPSEFRFDGNRAIVFEESDTVPEDSLGLCIAAALTYHRSKAATTAHRAGTGPPSRDSRPSP